MMSLQSSWIFLVVWFAWFSFQKSILYNELPMLFKLDLLSTILFVYFDNISDNSGCKYVMYLHLLHQLSCWKLGIYLSSVQVLTSYQSCSLSTSSIKDIQSVLYMVLLRYWNIFSSLILTSLGCFRCQFITCSAIPSRIFLFAFLLLLW